jgi:hypothetical protein
VNVSYWFILSTDLASIALEVRALVGFHFLLQTRFPMAMDDYEWKSTQSGNWNNFPKLHTSKHTFLLVSCRSSRVLTSYYRFVVG